MADREADHAHKRGGGRHDTFRREVAEHALPLLAWVTRQTQ